MNKSTYPFKIYTPIEAILMFILAIIGALCLLLFVSKYVVNVFNWYPVIGKAILLIIALSLFNLLQRFTSIELTAEITESGIAWKENVLWQQIGMISFFIGFEILIVFLAFKAIKKGFLNKNV